MRDGDLELRVAWQRHVSDTDPGAERFASVLARYREPHRHYHTVRHLTWVVRHVSSLASDHRLDDLGAVVAAAFYHDAIYVPGAADNETASADLARSALTELAWTPERSGSVADMIRATATHEHEGVAVDEAVLHAADLAVLAAEPAKYADYVRNVRREYAHVTDDEWNVGRARVLRAFVDRPAIFDPRLGLDAWEARARGNIASELRSLGV